MFTEKDLKQIRNLVISFYQKHKYFPLSEKLIDEYKMFFPDNLDENIKQEINSFINSVILEEISKKWTKWWQIMLKILKNNDVLWKKFRSLNDDNWIDNKDFQILWKKVETIIEQWESQLTEKLVWDKSMWIERASNAWYDMVYAIFPEWNQIV